MALIYFDSSALVKLLVQEEGSDLAAELWDGCDAALASRLAYPEVCAALAAACRNHDLSHEDLDVAGQSWEQYWASVRPVELTAAVEREAGQLARTHGLRGADAVHLASALALADPDLVIAVWNRRLHAGAATAGCTSPQPNSPVPTCHHHQHSRRLTPERTPAACGCGTVAGNGGSRLLLAERVERRPDLGRE